VAGVDLPMGTYRLRMYLKWDAMSGYGMKFRSKIKTETKDKIVDFVVDVIMLGLLFSLFFSIAQALIILVSPVKRLFT
jgi:hypothetical protein